MVVVVVVETVFVTIQEQADDIRDGTLEHCETNVGSPVVSICTAVVYVAQKAVTEGDWLN